MQSVLAGERVGFNNALHWAADWIKSSAQANGNSAVIEFAENMAMTFRANFRKEPPEPKDEYAAGSYHPTRCLMARDSTYQDGPTHFLNSRDKFLVAGNSVGRVSTKLI